MENFLNIEKDSEEIGRVKKLKDTYLKKSKFYLSRGMYLQWVLVRVNTTVFHKMSLCDTGQDVKYRKGEKITSI